MRKVFVRSTISIGQVLSVLLLAYFAWSFFSLFQNEFMVGTNDGNIKLIASYRKNKQSIARDEKIQDIIINGYKRSDFTRNTWIKEDNSHLLSKPTMQAEATSLLNTNPVRPLSVSHLQPMKCRQQAY